MKKLTNKIALKHLKKYGQYAKTMEWVNWYSKVAPLKGKRTAKLLLNYKNENAKLLDFGCGIGLTLSSLASFFSHSVGCDVGELEIMATKELIDLLGLNSSAVLYNGKRLPFKDNSFDIVTSVEVIEHVSKPNTMLKEIRRVLKPDGILHITTANRWWIIEPHYKLPFLSYLPKNLANIYIKLSKRGVSYDDINLPSYKEFYNIVNKYYKIEDVTLDTIKNYKKYDLDKERGLLIKIISWFLVTTSNLGVISKLINNLLVSMSLGWLFIARPRK